MPVQPVLIAGQWSYTQTAETFRAVDPVTARPLDEEYPISPWSDCEAALAAAAAVPELPPAQIARFLSLYADRITARREEIVAQAALETALPRSPRLMEVELPRTVSQLRQAAAAATDGSWAMPTIDTKLNIRSRCARIGPVFVMGPNNFPLAFNAVSGGDFAAAIAAGNPVIAKSHPCHPGTTRLLAEEAFAAVRDAGLPPATVQLLYELKREDGLRLVADRRIGATAFTGSRAAGLALKAAADAAGKPIYLEMSSLNPVCILPGALHQRLAKIADELTDSCLAAGGQFCTKPGLILLIAGQETEEFIAEVAKRFAGRKPVPLLSLGVAKALAASIKTLVEAGAQTVVGEPNTLLRLSAERFLAQPVKAQTEAFGNAAMLVVADDAGQAAEILEKLEGNLTGCVYSALDGSDDALAAEFSALLRPRVGRLLNDKMPTGVAVTAAMNHGGPFPSTGHPGFTSVGIPASLRRFARLECYDNVRPARLPAVLADKNPTSQTWRLIDGSLSQADA
jgi:NADP-dependent aldehyde dehydrogenase